MRFSRPLLFLSLAVSFGSIAALSWKSKALRSTSLAPTIAPVALPPVRLTQAGDVPLGGELRPLKSGTLPAIPSPQKAPDKTPTVVKSPTPQITAPPSNSQNLAPQTAGSNAIRVGLSTVGKAIEIWSPNGLILRDLKQPAHVLRTQGGERIQLISGPNFEAKSGAFKFTGPIFVQNGAKISQAWQRIQVQPLGDEPARVTTDGANAKWGHAYRGVFEVFPQQLPDAKRVGPLALVNVVAIEDYLKGVVPWEMSPLAPLEALKAQAICARTKALQFIQSSRFKKGDFDICDYDACQGYPGTGNEKPSTTRAVQETQGLALFSGTHVIDAVFSTNSGGITASAADVWKTSTASPYLPSVIDVPDVSQIKKKLLQGKMTESDWLEYVSQPWPAYAKPDNAARVALAARRRQYPRTAALYGDEDWPEFYRWKRVINVAQASKAFAAQGIAEVTSFEVLERAPSGHIRRLKVSGFTAPLAKTPVASPQTPFAGTAAPVPAPVIPTRSIVLEGDAQVRAMFSKRLGSTTALPSSTFVATPQTDASGKLTGWILLGAGWGHGVGMCQRGAQNHALEGWDARRILNWYYRGITIRDIGSARLSWWPRPKSVG